MANQATMAMPGSPASPIRRIEIIASAQPSAASSTMAMSNAGPGAARPGFSITSTPTKPTKTAPSFGAVILSPSSGRDSSVRNNGMVKPSAVTVASGMVA